MSAPQFAGPSGTGVQAPREFDKRVWGSPNPAGAPAEAHGHQEHACYHCPSPSNCDCPCATCIRCRRMRAGTACVACGSYEGLPAEREAGVVVECARCVAAAEEDSHSTDSHGGCPGCDGYFQCVCHEPGDDREDSDRHTELGDCAGCYPGCYGCDPHFDPSDPWGDGAPEEHPGHPGYNGGYDSD